MKLITALLAGALFGAGLLLSGMADPAIVLSFLDVSGAWNPALAFTMAGAIAVAAPAFLVVRRRQRRGDESPTLPDRTRIDRALLGGAAIFGVGWGMSGICPGPALLLLAGGTAPALVFAAAMFAGFLLSTFVQRK